MQAKKTVLGVLQASRYGVALFDMINLDLSELEAA